MGDGQFMTTMVWPIARFALVLLLLRQATRPPDSEQMVVVLVLVVVVVAHHAVRAIPVLDHPCDKNLVDTRHGHRTTRPWVVSSEPPNKWDTTWQCGPVVLDGT